MLITKKLEIDLCVAAAMDALKESAPPPWKLARPGLVPSPIASTSSSAADVGPGGMGGGGSEEMERETLEQPEEQGGAGGKEVLPPAPAQVSAGHGGAVVTMSVGGDGEGHETGAAAGVPLTSDISSSSATTPEAPTSTSSSSTSSTSSSAATSTASSTTTTTTTPLPPRILRKKHFTLALREISPSSAEGSSLKELRKWASKFGEGGTERGKKGGYGGKFGFGLAGEAEGEKESEYGRVRPGSGGD